MSWQCDAHGDHPADMVLTELGSGTVNALCMTAFLEAMTAMVDATRAAEATEPEPAPEPLGDPLPPESDPGEEVTPTEPAPAAEPTPAAPPAGPLPGDPGVEEPEPAEPELEHDAEPELAVTPPELAEPDPLTEHVIPRRAKRSARR